ncbi:MAG: serine protease [Planctomycetes bacterium]|nr:serine protease [Planctomycetota bacterium]
MSTTNRRAARPRQPTALLLRLGTCLAACLAPCAGPAQIPAQVIGPQQGQQAGPRESPFLGIFTEQKISEDRASGLTVTYLHPLSPAKEMGFQIGDEIKSLNDQIFLEQKGLFEALRSSNVNAKVRFVVLRAGKEVRLEGRLGSRDKVLRAYEDQARKAFAGKPPPPAPPLLAWDPAKKDFAVAEDPGPLDALRGKLSVVMAFDDCAFCKENRYQRLSQMKTVLSTTKEADRVAFLGIYYSESQGAQGKDAYRSAAKAFLEASLPAAPVALAIYPSGKPKPEDREAHFVVHNHGTMILGTDGLVSFLQIVGKPDQEFSAAFQKALLALGERGGKPGEPKKPSSP